VDKDCELAKYGLTINGETGALEMVAACETVGCGATEPFQVSCTLTAQQTKTLKATAQVVVSGVPFGYTASLLVATPQKKKFAPIVSSSKASIACVPSSAVDWLNIDDDGTLVASVSDLSRKGGITGYTELGLVGARCTVSATVDGASVSATVAVVSPQIWNDFRYDTMTVYATVGESSAPLKVIGNDKALLAPQRFSAYCDSDVGDFTFDTTTGVANLNGHEVFNLDLASGTLHVMPSKSLEITIDDLVGDGNTRKNITLACKVFGHYVENPLLPSRVASSRLLTIQLRDNTCWDQRTANFAGTAPQATGMSLAGCWKACRKELSCTDFYLEGDECIFMTGTCLKSSCPVMSQTVYTKIPGCGERTSCMLIIHVSLGYVSGTYCPAGETTAGPVYLKRGDTVAETLYLAPYDPVRDAGLTWNSHPDSSPIEPCEDMTDIGTFEMQAECKAAVKATQFNTASFQKADGKCYACNIDGVKYTESVGTTSFELSDPVIDCKAGMYVIKQSVPGEDFSDPESSYMELMGESVKCVETDKDFIDEVFSNGRFVASARSAMGDPTLIASIAGMACGPPNTTASSSDEEEGTEEVSVSALVLDDPATIAPADHWMHPCDCFPESWGPEAPVSGDAYQAVPAGSDNMFSPDVIQLLDGQFACEEDFLLDGTVITEGSKDMMETASCQAHCREDDRCKFFWEGEVMSVKQCRLYSDCHALVREAGITGTLNAMPDSSKKYCHVADPELCWAVTGRRSSMRANPSSERLECEFLNLVAQCDQKLLIGGFGINSCSRCSYKAVDDVVFDHKIAIPKTFVHGQKLGVSCWQERFRAAPAGAGAKTSETITCVSGSWIDSGGALGLSDFSCGACIQIVSPPYAMLDKRGKQELYFASNIEVQVPSKQRAPWWC
jgi:hypothetical protein